MRSELPDDLAFEIMASFERLEGRKPEIEFDPAFHNEVLSMYTMTICWYVLKDRHGKVDLEVRYTHTVVCGNPPQRDNLFYLIDDIDVGMTDERKKQIEDELLRFLQTYERLRLHGIGFRG